MPLITSSGLEEASLQGKRAIDWEPQTIPAWTATVRPSHIRRGIGFAMAMHGTAIPGLDMGGASSRSTTTARSTCSSAPPTSAPGPTPCWPRSPPRCSAWHRRHLVYSSDTDMTPFDTGAYASSTTYISGMACKRAAEEVGIRSWTGSDDARVTPGTIELRDRAPGRTTVDR